MLKDKGVTHVFYKKDDEGLLKGLLLVDDNRVLLWGGARMAQSWS